jgi:shikimate dehydrogenase
MRLYGLIGKTLTHSFSGQFFAKKFAREGIADCRYDLFPLAEIGDLSGLIQSQPSLRGLNVTIPYKQDVMAYLDSQAIPKEIGACNCIDIREGKLIGYNTDWIGFEKSLLPLLEPRHRAAMVLGSGGASLAVRYVLKKNGIPYTLVGRSRNSEIDMTYDELDAAALQSHSIIINTTPLGTYPSVDTCPPLPYEAIGPQHLLYDLVYNPAKTVFLQKGEERGARIKNGEEMLILQAEESWRIWNQDAKC